jgi:hypothetical protein
MAAWGGAAMHKVDLEMSAYVAAKLQGPLTQVQELAIKVTLQAKKSRVTIPTGSLQQLGTQWAIFLGGHFQHPSC